MLRNSISILRVSSRPVSIESLDKIEAMNPRFGFNIFAVSKDDDDKHEVYPLRICKDLNIDHSPYEYGLQADPSKRMIVRLLLIQEGEKTHYVLIKNMSRLISSQVNNHQHAIEICNNCLLSFPSKVSLKKHYDSGCYNNDCVKIKLPVKSKAVLSYDKRPKHIQKLLKVPFAIYADFESILVPQTDVLQNHQTCSFGYKIVSSFEEYEFPYKSFRGQDAVKEFLHCLVEETNGLQDIIHNERAMIITPEQEREFLLATHCHICKESLSRPKKVEGFYGPEVRVRDHCRISGLFRGAAHQSCNLLYNYSKMKIPVIFHNLKGYDSHFIIREIDTIARENDWKLDIIAQSSEKYLTFSLGKLQFIDSLNFLLGSLDNLSKTQMNSLGLDGFPNLLKENPHLSRDQLSLISKKGVYPYDYMDSHSKFEETCLPPREKFFSQLTGMDIKYDDYEHAKNVWRDMDCKTMGDYHDIYLKTDVLLLADVFEKFRDLSIRIYGLDPCHYFSAASLTWDSMLKFTKVELQLFHDEQSDMLNLVDGNKRGGVSSVGSKRYSKANVPGTDDYDPSKPNTFLLDKSSIN